MEILTQLVDAFPVHLGAFQTVFGNRHDLLRSLMPARHGAEVGRPAFTRVDHKLADRHIAVDHIELQPMGTLGDIQRFDDDPFAVFEHRLLPSSHPCIAGLGFDGVGELVVDSDGEANAAGCI